jgi:hypothetical protein
MNESRSHHGQWVPDSHVPLEGMLGQIAGSSWAWHASCSCPAHPHPSSASHWPPTCKLQSGSILAVVVIRWNHLRLGMKLYLLDMRGEQMFPAASWMATGACRLYVCFHLTTFIIHMGNDYVDKAFAACLRCVISPSKIQYATLAFLRSCASPGLNAEARFRGLSGEFHTRVPSKYVVLPGRLFNSPRSAELLPFGPGTTPWLHEAYN